MQHAIIASHASSFPLLIHDFGHPAPLDTVGVINVRDRFQEPLAILRRDILEQTAISRYSLEDFDNLAQPLTMHPISLNHRWASVYRP